MVPASVERSVQDGLEMATFAGAVRAGFVEAGRLVAPSGRLVVADAARLWDSRPLKVAIGAGRHPVVLTLLRYEDGDERIAAARVVLSDGAVSAWRAAKPELFEVQSGTAAFCDGGTVARMAAGPAKARGAFDRKLEQQIEANYRDTRSWAELVVEPRGGANAVACSSGFGDGGYGCYLGYDAKEKLVCVLADFGLLLTQEEIDDMADQAALEGA